MKAVIKPSKARGTVEAPPSKSMAHRMLICAGLAKGRSVVRGIAPSQDVLATLDCLEALGAEYKYENNIVTIQGADISSCSDKMTMPCRECGSTLRFFIPIALMTGADVEFTGSETLLKRPLLIYEELCEKNGFKFQRETDSLKVQGKLKSGEYEVQGNISSQFISGLLFALPLAEKDSIIRLIPPVESRPYIDMTLQALNDFGIDVFWQDENTLLVKGNQTYLPKNTQVEGDYSNAAFFEALNLCGGDVKVTGLKPDSLQGDKIYSCYFDKMKQEDPVLDISDCPDLGPILMAAAAIRDGAVFTGTKRLKIKESDRGTAMQTELAKFGIRCEVEEDRITVENGKLAEPEEVLSGHNDHRIVMALAVLSTLTGGVIEEAQAVRKSFPDFFEKLKGLGIEVETDGMDK